MTSVDKYSPFAIFALLVASCGGFLFGYHTAIISGILNILANSFQLHLLQEGFLVSILLLGGIVGALFAGMLSDRWGRRNVMFMTSLLFLVVSVILALAEGYFLFVIGRLICGIAIGITSVVSPLYLAEIAPPHYRGRFVSCFQIMIALGILGAYGVNAFFIQQESWRIVFWIGLIPTVGQGIGLLFLPESPGWLFRKGRAELAAKALARLRRDRDWKKHLDEMEKSGLPLSGKRGWNRKLIVIVSIGLLLSIFQQITGINTIIYYTPTIFAKTAGSSVESSLMATLIVGIANCLVTLIAVWLIDKVGRRILLLVGSMGMVISLALLVTISRMGANHVMTVTSVVGYVGFFALSLGPITWVVLSEIFPLKIRGLAMGLALFANWLFNYLVSLTFLLLVQKLGIDGSFILYAAICLLCFLFVLFFIPETKGKSLEQIEHMLKL